MDKEVKIDSIVIIAKCSDGKYRQLSIDTVMEQYILLTIQDIEGKINLIDKDLEGIEIIKNKQSNGAESA